MNPINHTANGRRFLMVTDIPEGEYYEKKMPDGGVAICCNIIDGRGNKGRCYINLPPGTYTLIGRADQLTEDVAAGIVELANDQMVDFHPHYKDYTSESWEDDFTDPHLSVASLCASHGLSTSTTIILEQIG